jgi:ArsR family transcriptional regulator, arsenate/arsenite/antimonite-responsive transcriptional repressor
MNILQQASSEEILSARLAALSHPARLAILKHLAASGCCCCKDVVQTVDLAQSTVSQHLKILVEAGLVRYQPDRQRSRYEIDRAAVAELSSAVSALLQSCCGPTGCGQR